jgi:thiamine pyrophosphate-dependent acetolactate synthase large subunit-like protein
VGNALGTALGAAVGAPHRLTVLCIGDGGLMMTLGDLETAVRCALPLLVVVCNDRAYGAEMHYLRMLGMSDREARFDNPSFEQVARSLGAEGATIVQPADLTSLRERLPHLRGPLVLDCRVNPEVRAQWLEDKFAVETLEGLPPQLSTLEQ